jgi:NADPH-dependent 2,4-dienoyl-CoA reductase/sulfur reductase-like enzyme
MSDPQIDLVVIGAGPAGMAAACEARSLGLTVTLLDERPSVGGQIYRNIETATADRLDILGPDYAAGRVLADDFRRSQANYLGGAAVWNVGVDGTVDYIADGKANQLSSRYVLLASGAMERPFPVSGWNLPGAMGAGAAQILLKGSGAFPSDPAVLVGCGPLLYLLAWQYLRAGVAVRAVVDTTSMADYLRAAPYLPSALRGWRDMWKGLKLLKALRRSDVQVFSGAKGISIQGTTRVEGLSFVHGRRTFDLEADLVLLHQGVVPNTQLSWSVGTKHEWNDSQLCWEPVADEWGRLGETSLYVAGDSRRIVGAQASAVQGQLAALAIAGQLDPAVDSSKRVAQLRRKLADHTRIRPFLDALYRPKIENRVPVDDAVVVCRCEEVTAGQIRNYVELGCRGPNQTKAFSRCGMGPCQGRFCGLTVTEIIAKARGVPPSEVGYYRIRPPITPVMIGNFVDD